MSWLRIDDRFGTHPKVAGLKRADRWTWMELLCYCALHNTAGAVPSSIGEHLRYATPAFLENCLELGLLDADENGALHVHDWRDYNPKDPTAADRMARHRERQRNPDRNENRNADRNVTEPRVRARAHGPVPSRPTTSNDVDDDGTSEADLVRARAARAGWNSSQLRPALLEPGRALAWLDAAKGAANPAAFAWAGFGGGGWPDADDARTVDVAQAAGAWLESQAWDDSFDELAIAEELERIARRPSVAGVLDLAGALAYWRELRADRYPNGGNDGGT